MLTALAFSALLLFSGVGCRQQAGDSKPASPSPTSGDARRAPERSEPSGEPGPTPYESVIAPLLEGGKTMDDLYRELPADVRAEYERRQATFVQGVESEVDEAEQIEGNN